MFLLDTNVLSEFVRPALDHNVARWVHTTDEELTFVSVITIAELRHGIEKLDAGRRKTSLAQWLDDDLQPRFEGRILDVTQPIAETWGGLMAASKRRGAGLQVMDAFIAATSIWHAFTLVTRNTRDFQSLGLELVNPWSATQVH